jgi:hypothetical protein
MPHAQKVRPLVHRQGQQAADPISQLVFRFQLERREAFLSRGRFIFRATPPSGTLRFRGLKSHVARMEPKKTLAHRTSYASRSEKLPR